MNVQVRSDSAGAGYSPTKPVSPQQRGPYLAGRPGGHGRKRTLDAAFGNGTRIEPSQASPTSAGDSYEEKDESRIGVKRACNECRQQKLRCDVVQEPFSACSRCRRCSLDCRIDSTFKRVGKRKRNAEMEREIVELRNKLATQQGLTSPIAQTHPSHNNVGLTPAPLGQPVPHISPSPLDQYMGSQEAVASLLDLKSGGERGFGRSPGPDGKTLKRLDGVVLTSTQADELFRIFFAFYHPVQPLLEPDRSADHYFEKCTLLFWTVISVAIRHHCPSGVSLHELSKSLTQLLWVTIADVPQSYLVVKALCMLCVWPLPISSTSTDPTFMISGLMMQIAMQIGLHRPSHAQDFSKFTVHLREEELKDRVKTWAACNVVAQRVSTGYGQPASTHYDWTLQASGMKESGFKLPDKMDARLRVEQCSDRITKTLYGNRNDSIGYIDEKEKFKAVDSLAKELTKLQAKCKNSPTNMLYLHAATLHLRLSVFFDSPNSATYQSDLMNLWTATTKLLEDAFNLKHNNASIIQYSTNYILQMIIASGFTLLKLLNSFFARSIDLEYGKGLFTRTIQMIRQISVIHNDLPSRLAEVLAQLWRAGGAGSPPHGEWNGTIDDSLQLKVRCRMSMSLVYDSVWRWREDFQSKGRDNLETALKNPTNPDSSNSTVGTTPSVPAIPEAHGLPLSESISNKALDPMLGIPTSTGGSRAPTPSADFGFGAEWSNEVFDPLNWMLDGVVDFPYVYEDNDPLGQSLGAI